MTTYVLAGGAWLGGWCWQPVARRLRDQGHDVYPVTFTGLGERAHLATPDIDLDTYIADIVNLIEFEDLHDVVLLGHSFAGIVVDCVAARIPDRLAQLVYLDSGPFPDGTAYVDIQGPDAGRLVERLMAEQGDGWRLPMPSWDQFAIMGAGLDGLGDAERALMRAHAVAQPFRTWTQPLRLPQPIPASLPKVLISNSFPLAQVREMIAAGHPWFAELGGPEWRLLALPTGHWPMFSVPDELAAMLHEIGQP